MDTEAPSCETPRALTTLKRPLRKLADAMQRQKQVTLVAIGSSSTEGDGSTNWETLSYPPRLQDFLNQKIPQTTFTVIRSGMGGQEAADEVARFETDVMAKDPALVIWQVGTNAAWKGYILEEVQAAIRQGLAQLSFTAADVILMNLQYAPALISNEIMPATERMLGLIDAAAETAGVNVFDRYNIMKHWNTVRGIPFEQMLSNFDGNWLHQNDWSYNCIASALADAIAGALPP